MTLTQQELYAALTRREPWHPKAADWRKLPNGRIMRFVRWSWRDPIPQREHTEAR